MIPEDLVKISHFYGANKDYIIAGGGNTSFKTSDIMLIKASGFSLANIDERGFVALDRSKITKMLDMTYSSEIQQREKEVKDRLMDCRADIIHGGRPSVEAPFHHLVGYQFVVHTHPYLVNAMLSGQDAQKNWAELFGKDTLYIPYVDPGYTLAKRIQTELSCYQKAKNEDPHIIFLENHGVIVSADSAQEIHELYAFIMKKISTRIPKFIQIENRQIPSQYQKLDPIIRSAVGGNELFIGIRNNSLIAYFYENQNCFKIIEQPFNPDTVVYCKAGPIYIGQMGSLNTFTKTIHTELDLFRKKWGYLPRVLLIKNIGLIAVDPVEKNVQIALEMFEDGLKVGYYTQYFGGPHGMSFRDIRFIDGWEVEQYRRQVVEQKRN